jgi:hypothetical protein
MAESNWNSLSHWRVEEQPDFNSLTSTAQQQRIGSNLVAKGTFADTSP